MRDATSPQGEGEERVSCSNEQCSFKMLTPWERKLPVLQTESHFPFTQITYIFKNVNSPAFPLRVQFPSGCFAMLVVFFTSLNMQIRRRLPWLQAWKATLNWQQAGLWTTPCSLGREGCSAAHQASHLQASLPGHAHHIRAMSRRGAGFAS